MTDTGLSGPSNPSGAAALFRAAAEGKAVVLPQDVREMTPFTSLSRGTLKLLGPGVLERLSEKVLALELDAGFGSSILTLLHDQANVAREEQRPADAHRAFETILKHAPWDYNVRVALTTFVDPGRDPERVRDLLSPVIGELLKMPEVYGSALAVFSRASFALGDFDQALSVAKEIGEAVAANSAVRSRVQLLSRMPKHEAPTNDAEKAVIDAALALDEFQMLERLEASRRAVLNPEALASLVGCILAAYEEGWSQAYAFAVSLASGLISEEPDLENLGRLWAAAGLPQRGLVAVLALGAARGSGPASGVPEVEIYQEAARGIAKGEATEALSTAIVRFKASATLASARHVWAATALEARYLEIQRFLPRDDAAESSLSGVLDVAQAGLRGAANAAPAADLWFFTTWHDNGEHLLRLLSALRDRHVTNVVSIGGSGLPEELGLISVALILPRFHYILNPVVSWGGQKLLFHNLFQALESFSDKAPENARLQVICNRTYPLVSPREMGQKIAEDSFNERHHALPAPPAWRGEWPTEIADKLPEILDEALTDIFAKCDGSKFQQLSTMPGPYGQSDYRKDQNAFNFSTKAAAFESNFKNSAQTYNISAHASDMRWMSYGRLVEFVDVSSEVGATYTRPMHPIVQKWTHRVLSQHSLRTGDPFVLMTKEFAKTVLSEDCVELFAAMNSGFAPEMNFFDTVANSPQYQMNDQLHHCYYRTPDHRAIDSEIGPASFASQVNGRLFARKITPESGSFVSFFAAKISSGWDQQEFWAAFPSEKISSLPVAMIPRLMDFIEDRFIGKRCRLRNLFNGDLGFARFDADGQLVSEEGLPWATWVRTDVGISVDFVVNGWGRRIYEQMATDGEMLILPPSEIVSERNAWSVFFEFDLTDLMSENVSVHVASSVNPPYLRSRRCTAGASCEAVLLGAFAAGADVCYPGTWLESEGMIVERRTSPVGQLWLASLDDFPVLLCLESTSFADGRCVQLLKRASASQVEAWDEAVVLAPSRTSALTGDDLVGAYHFVIMEHQWFVSLGGDGSLRDEAGHLIGRWETRESQVWFLGMPGVSVALGTQFSGRDKSWAVSGWAYRKLGDMTTFSLQPMDIGDRN